MPGPIDGLRKVGPSNMVEQELADLFNEILQTRTDYPWKPTWEADYSKMEPPPPPPGFREATLMPPNVGTFADEEAPWEFLRRVVPNLEGRTPSIQVGPTGAAVDRLLGSGFGPEDFGRTNLLGGTDIEGGRVSLNPDLAAGRGQFLDFDDRGRSLLDRTTAHEMAHVAGEKYHTRRLSNIEGLMDMARQYNRMNRGGQ